jgi:hypothetical protein
MKIRLLDDLHTEFGPFVPDFKVKADVCLLAGDIGLAPSSVLLETVTNIAKQHDMTILVPGNHEYYHSEWHAANRWMLTTLKKHVASEGAYLEVFAPHGFVEFQGVPFIGGTFWTDFNNGDPMDMMLANRRMNDFQLIKFEDVNYELKNWQARDAFLQNQATRRFLEERLDHYKDPRTIIVTHHAPIWQCADPAFRGDRLTAAYCNTGLEPWFLEKEFAAWCHGHCHNSNRMEVNERAIFSNARGYHGYALNNSFNPDFVFEV